MRILVCGGRDFDDAPSAFAALDRVHLKRGVSCVIEGGARGADRLGSEWASSKGIPVVRCPADWKQHGRSAGFVRNRSMLLTQRPDMVVAFPGGSGTAHMIDLARSSGFTVWQPLSRR